MVHYSIFDDTGKQLAGGVASTYFPSNSNDIFDIMGSNFPDIADHVTNRLPLRAREKTIDGQRLGTADFKDDTR